MVRAQPVPRVQVTTITTAELSEAERSEALAFLGERPLHTVFMAGLIRDNGLVSPHNRGTFYGCRDTRGRLEGIALIGHATLIEARTQRAVSEFARVAQTHTRTHMIMGEQSGIEQFWNAYADDGQQMNRICRELLLELLDSGEPANEVEGLRPATPADLDLIAPVHAAMAEAEGGVNPLHSDPVGFLARCLRRIEKGRVWVVVEDGRLLFKADVQSETPDVIYLEGVWVAPDMRGTELGRRCMNHLANDFLTRSAAVCVLVNEENSRAQSFYRKCGFRLCSIYETIFLRREMGASTSF